MSKRNDLEGGAARIPAGRTGASTLPNPTPKRASSRNLTYYIAERLRTAFRRPAFTIAFMPMAPRRSHLIWGVNRRAGGHIIRDPHKADAVFFFDDKTASKAMRRPNPMVPGFNFFCSDLSKSRIVDAFSGVFGYDLAVKPDSYIGKMVVQSNRKGAREPRVEMGPIKPEADHTYHRLIDNEMQSGFVADFHCPTVKGEVPLVYVKVRPKHQRFETFNTSVALVPPEDVFSADELAKISQFCSDIGLDWGQIDILRDKNDGRIYIVDVNKTDIGPPPALPLKDKLRSADILAKAFKEVILEKPGLIESHISVDNDTGIDVSDIPLRIAP